MNLDKFFVTKAGGLIAECCPLAEYFDIVIGKNITVEEVNKIVQDYLVEVNADLVCDNGILWNKNTYGKPDAKEVGRIIFSKEHGKFVVNVSHETEEGYAIIGDYIAFRHSRCMSGKSGMRIATLKDTEYGRMLNGLVCTGDCCSEWKETAVRTKMNDKE